MRTLVTRRTPPADVGRPRFTPEHLQLLSDSRLHALCADQPAAKPSPFAKLAMRELRRRHGPPHRPAA